MNEGGGCQTLVSRTERTRLKVLYIAGSGRSGSTLLQNMLGEIESFQALGELCSIGRATWRGIAVVVESPWTCVITGR